MTHVRSLRNCPPCYAPASCASCSSSLPRSSSPAAAGHAQTRAAGVARLRRRRRRATRYSPLTDINRAQRRLRCRSPGRGSRREARCRSSAPSPALPEHAADDRRRAVPEHAVQPRRRARRARAGASCGATIPSRSRTASRPTAPASCTAASPRGATKRAAAHLHQQPLSADLPRREDRRAGDGVRRRRASSI